MPKLLLKESIKLRPTRDFLRAKLAHVDTIEKQLEWFSKATKIKSPFIRNMSNDSYVAWTLDFSPLSFSKVRRNYSIDNNGIQTEGGYLLNVQAIGASTWPLFSNLTFDDCEDFGRFLTAKDILHVRRHTTLGARLSYPDWIKLLEEYTGIPNAIFCAQ